MHSGERYSLPFTLLAFTLRHKMTDSVLSISGCFVQLRVPAVLLADPNCMTEGQHLEELGRITASPPGLIQPAPQAFRKGIPKRWAWGEEKREGKAERKRPWSWVKKDRKTALTPDQSHFSWSLLSVDGCIEGRDNLLDSTWNRTGQCGSMGQPCCPCTLCLPPESWDGLCLLPQF